MFGMSSPLSSTFVNRYRNQIERFVELASTRTGSDDRCRGDAGTQRGVPECLHRSRPADSWLFPPPVADPGASHAQRGGAHFARRTWMASGSLAPTDAVRAGDPGPAVVGPTGSGDAADSMPGFLFVIACAWRLGDDSMLWGREGCVNGIPTDKQDLNYEDVNPTWSSSDFVDSPPFPAVTHDAETVRSRARSRGVASP